MLFRKYFTTLFFFPAFLYSQTNDSLLNRINEQFARYALLHNSPGIYLHVDKSIYVPNEHIWFTSYFVNPVADINSYHTLYVLLVDKLSKQIVANDRFVISNGIGKGQILMQDSFPAGEYKLIAYSNTMLDNANMPVYQQSISLRSSYKATWTMTIQENTLSQPDSFVTRVMSADYVFAKGGIFNYTLYGDSKPLYSDTKVIDRYGEVHIPVLPENTAMKLELEATVYYKKDTLIFRQPVEITPMQVTMKFYPEGGNLVDGHLSKVAFELTGRSKALATTGTLLQNGKPVTKFISNQNGLGTFKLTPKAGDKYTIILDEEKPHVLHAAFPAIELSGYTIAVETGVTNDVLKILIQPHHAKSECIVLLHNYEQEFYSARISIKGATGLLTIPVKDLPAGVATITVLDTGGIPVAERAVLIKPNKQVQANMVADSDTYHKRGKAQLKVKVRDENNQPVQASISFACILASRLDTTRFIDINRYQLFDQFLPTAGVLPSLSYFNDETNSELVLLTWFWTRYDWNKLNNILKPQRLAGNYGYVLYRDKLLKHPIALTLFGKKNFEEIITDSSGRFEVPSYKLNAPADSKLLLSIANTKTQDDYKIVLKNDLDSLNTFLAGKDYNSFTVEKDELSAAEKKGNRNVLRTVIINSKKNGFDFEGAIYHSANCNDYVCMYNILNCKNHPGGSPPVNGNTYLYRDNNGTGMHRVIYYGCTQQQEPNEFIRQLKGTYFPKEFYVPDYSKYSPAEEETYTTVYWSHQIITDKNGEAIISFYTNDLAGRFICVLEGMSEKGPVSGKIKFEVRKD